MKHDWEYKKLGEICDKGSSNISLNKIEDNIGEYALFGASGYVKGIDFYHNENPYIGIVKDGSGCGRVNIYPAKSSLVGTMQYIYPKQNCDIKFLMYLLQSLDLSSLVTGAAIPHIYFKDYSKFSIPVPPLPTQQSIVSELDSLSKIIADCKVTLKDYDALEQSIFYDMFGDPVKNDKGWEVKKIEDVYSLKAGKTIKANELSEEPSEGLYPCFGGNGIRGYIAKKSHCGSYPIIGRQGALCGNVNFAEGEFYATEHAVVVSNKIECNPLFSYFLLTNMKLERLAKGVAQPGLSVASVNEENSILPPLPLQQQFASKIEAIEKMKSETKKALQEAETLFNARMDYWFN